MELDVRLLDDGAREALRGWIGLYKQLRDRLHRGCVWTGQTEDGVRWQAHGDDQAEELLLLAYRLQPSSHRYTPPLRLNMLPPEDRYQARELRPEGNAQEASHHGSAPFFETLRTTGLTLDGAWLAQAGLPLPRAQAQTCFIVHLQRLRA